MSEAFDPADYSFVVKRRGNPPRAWKWEISRWSVGTVRKLASLF
jgi:hypothetical protein